MACETTKYVGRDVVLEYSIGCGDKKPLPGAWKRFGSLRTKEFALSWDTTDVTDSDSVGALRENLATFQTLTISGDGIAKASGVGNLVELTKHFVSPTATNGQPVVWLRMTFPDLTFTAFMLLSNLSRSAPYDDAVTYSLEAMATASDFGLIVEDTIPPTPITSIAVTPTTGTISTPGGTLQLSASALPASANQAVTWSSSAPTIATVNATGLVTALADGNAVITAKSTSDPTKSATASIAVTGQ